MVAAALRRSAWVAARVEVGWCGQRRHLRGREREAEGEVVRARGAAPADRALQRAVLLQHGEGGARGDPRGRAALHVLVFDWGRCRGRLGRRFDELGRTRPSVRKPSLFAPQTSMELVRPLVFEPLFHHGACRLHTSAAGTLTTSSRRKTTAFPRVNQLSLPPPGSVLQRGVFRARGLVGWYRVGGRG